MAKPGSTWDFLRGLIALGLARTSDGNLYPPPLNVVAKTAAYTIVPGDPCGTLFTNRGAVGAVIFTLPDPTAVAAGTWYDFLGVAGQNMSVVTAIADTLIAFNDAAADSVAISTAGALIGAHARAVCDGTQWAFLGDTVGVTYTVAT